MLIASRAAVRQALTLVDGGRAALERELLWLVALGNADTPRAIELHRMLSVRKLGSLRLVGQIGDAAGGAKDAEPGPGGQVQSPVVVS